MSEPIGYMVVSYDECGKPWLDAGWEALYSDPVEADPELKRLAADEPESLHVVCAVVPLEPTL